TLRWLLFSPVPTHTVSGRVGATVTQPMLAVLWSSKIGANEVPAFVVFHTPPYADATYHTRRSLGSTARSTTRPEVTAGPIARNLSPANVPAESLPSGLVGLAADLAAGLDSGFAVEALGAEPAGFAADGAVLATGGVSAGAAASDAAARREPSSV